MSSSTRFEDWEARRLEDLEFQAEVERLEPAYQVARLRILRQLTQEELAKRVGTKQSSIARLESGKSEPSLSFLRRVVEALGGRLEVRIVAQEETLEAPPALSMPTHESRSAIGPEAATTPLGAEV